MFKRKLSNKEWLLAALALVSILIVSHIVLLRYRKKNRTESTTKSAGGLQVKPPAPLFSPPVLPEEYKRERKPVIAVVIDDLGYDEAIADKLAQINLGITISILPYLPNSQTTAQNAHKRGQEILLHIPMEPLDEEKLYPLQPGMLLLEMSASQIRREIGRQLSAVPHIVGANNHMGSLFTGSRQAVLPVLEQIQNQGLFFMDSVTGPHSVAYDTAVELGIPALQRDIFLDDLPDKDYTLHQLALTVKLAREKGSAIAIGHPHLSTIEALEEFIPQLEGQGVELVKVSQLLDL
ncbi:MAG: divergent polysaccharide deacetylase family protein [Candidatus Schekmanbacteria bacterium]|nr:divergent polysaccharide deacetylase family protein [Candidatus Schekmanbacteria bacterium]